MTEPELQQIKSIVGQANGQAWAALRQLDGRLKAVEAARKDGQTGLIPRFIEDIPGKRVPYTEIARRTGTTEVILDTAPAQLTFTVSQDGPFVAVWVSAHWRPTVGSNVGRWRPISSIGAGLNNAADAVDFEYSIETSGADRLWQNEGRLRASKDLFSDGDRPHYLGIAGFIERNSVVTVEVTMLRVPENAGLLTFEFHGYKILQPIAFAG